MKKTLIIIPTYNEAENILTIMKEVLAVTPANVELLIVDDNSPDGTGGLVTGFLSSTQRTFLLSRPMKDGLAGAYIAGFKWGLEKDFSQFIQMDADFSHSPKDLPRLLETLKTSEVVIGSRYIPGGGTSGWSWPRQLISRGGNVYVQAILATPYHDMTGGFNAWQRHVLESVCLDTIKSKGYAYQVEMKYRAHRRGFKITEIPIHFQNRLLGYSKMSKDIVREAAIRVFKMRNTLFA